MITLETHNSEFERLKRLLFSDEQRTLTVLEEKLTQLQLESIDKSVIRARVLPLFDEMLLQRLKEEGSETVTIFAEHIAKILQKAADTNPKALTNVLKETISETIAKEIESNKDTMIDALYPILGGMISKYVSQSIKEMVESINKKIDDGLSADRIKRKIKSKVTGVSETELLLEESSDAHLKALFIIQKESGMLIAQAQHAEKEMDDPYMVASMASAIKDFVNDWVEEQNDTKEVQILSYGNATLYIESAGTVYTIAFLDSEPGYKQRAKINRFFASLVQEYAELFKSFDGDDSLPEIEQLTVAMQGFMTEKSPNKSEEGEKTSYFKYMMGVVLLLLVFWMGSYAYQAYRYADLERTLKEQTGYTVTLDEVEGKLLVSGEVHRFEDEQKILALILKEVAIPVDNQLKMSLTDMMDIFSTRDENLSSTLQDDVLSRDSRYKQAFKNLNATLETREKAYRRKIGALEESLEGYADKLEVLQKRFESYLEVEAHRKAEIKRLKSLHQQILSSLQNSQWLGYYLDPGEGTLDFADSHMFDAGNRELSVESKQTLSSHYTVLIKEMMKVQDARKYLKAIVVEGHTDSSGTAVQNQRISRERAEVVKDLFASLEITAQYQLAPLLIAKGMSNRFPMMKNGKEDQSASRRIKIKFDLDTIQIEKEIDRLLND